MLFISAVGYSIFFVQTSRKAAFLGLTLKKHSVFKVELMFYWQNFKEKRCRI